MGISNFFVMYLRLKSLSGQHFEIWWRLRFVSLVVQTGILISPLHMLNHKYECHGVIKIRYIYRDREINIDICTREHLNGVPCWDFEIMIGENVPKSFWTAFLSRGGISSLLIFVMEATYNTNTRGIQMPFTKSDR